MTCQLLRLDCITLQHSIVIIVLHCGSKLCNLSFLVMINLLVLNLIHIILITLATRGTCNFLHCEAWKTPKFIDHNLKANYQILIIFGTTIPDTTCHPMIIQVSTSPNICFRTIWRNQNTWSQCWNEQKTLKTIRDIIDNNLEKDNKILIRAVEALIF